MDGDLISRRAMLEAIDERERIARKYVPDIQEDELRPTLKSIREFVNNRPAVDAEPVRHGRWIQAVKEDDDWYGTFPVYTCSACNWSIGDNPTGWGLFCPHCGARMDEEDMKDGKTD